VNKEVDMQRSKIAVTRARGGARGTKEGARNQGGREEQRGREEQGRHEERTDREPVALKDRLKARYLRQTHIHLWPRTYTSV